MCPTICSERAFDEHTVLKTFASAVRAYCVFQHCLQVRCDLSNCFSDVPAECDLRSYPFFIAIYRWGHAKLKWKFQLPCARRDCKRRFYSRPYGQLSRPIPKCRNPFARNCRVWPTSKLSAVAKGKPFRERNHRGEDW